MTILHIDFETFSACDLKTRGLDNYAKDPSTGVHCMAFAFDDADADILHSTGCIAAHVESGGLVYAHNAAFELAIWNNVMTPRYGWPALRPEQVRCTMAMCYAMGLPGALENAAPALGLAVRKDAEGKRIMLKWCQPKADGSFWKQADDPAQFQRLLDYCRQDVEVERAIHGRLLELSGYEQKVWQLDYKINQAGVAIDMASVQNGIQIVEKEKARLNARMLQVTGGVVGSCFEVQLLVKWIRSQGVELKGVAKADVLDALSDEGLPANVRVALELRKEAARSSTAKLKAMADRVGADGRLRNLHQYHGAATGRWAGRGVQIQNLTRPRRHAKDDDAQVESVRKINRLIHSGDFEELDMLFGPVMDAVADGIRGLLVAAPGHNLIAVDFSAIEARVLAWLAGETSVLRIFESKEDIYKAAASKIFHVAPKDVTKDQRQIGKVAVLALGYGGGVGAFQQMAKGYNVKVKDEEADEIKVNWRQGHQNIVRFWYALDEAAMRALRTGQVEKAGPVAFRKKGSFLWCKLPSGRMLCYPYPELRQVVTPWGDDREALTYMTEVEDPKKAKVLDDPNSFGKWKRISTYGGSLAENVTQAVARDLLADVMLRLDEQGAKIVMHVHDEAVMEVPSDWNPGLLKKMESFMSVGPNWAAGLPLAAEGWRDSRYRK